MAIPSSGPPPRHLPKLFRPSQIAVISSHSVRDRIRPQQKNALVFWNWADEALTVPCLQDCHLPFQCWSTRARGCGAGTYQPCCQCPMEPCWQWQPFPGNPCPQAGLFPVISVKKQVGHNPSSSLFFSSGVPQLSHVLECGHHIHLCMLMGKKEIGRCWQRS